MKVGSLRDDAYDRIRAKLALGQLAAGSEISEPMLAEMLGISRTPVREALQQLETEGLVERTPKRSTVVRMPDRNDILDLYEVREAVEVFAAGLAAERRTATDLDRLRYLCSEMKIIADDLQKSNARVLSDAKLRRLLAADMGFHLIMIQATGNRHIMKIVADSHVMSRVFGAPRQEHDIKVVKENYRVHKEIFQAVESSNSSRAGELMAKHIQSTLQETLEYFDSLRPEDEETEEPRNPSLLPDYLIEEFKRIGLILKSQ
jgi:DNA-binding GntR family transcriptional regulator